MEISRRQTPGQISDLGSPSVYVIASTEDSDSAGSGWLCSVQQEVMGKSGVGLFM